MKTLITILSFAAILPNSLLSETAKQPEIKKSAPTSLSLQQVIDTCAAYYRIPRGVIIGVATNETKMGKGGVGVPEKANNLFGVQDGKYDDWHGGQYTACDSCFKWRKYPTPQASVPDFCKFITLHYSHHIGKPVELWSLPNYGSSKYVRGWFTQFE